MSIGTRAPLSARTARWSRPSPLRPDRTASPLRQFGRTTWTPCPARHLHPPADHDRVAGARYVLAHQTPVAQVSLLQIAGHPTCEGWHSLSGPPEVQGQMLADGSRIALEGSRSGCYQRCSRFGWWLTSSWTGARRLALGSGPPFRALAEEEEGRCRLRRSSRKPSRTSRGLRWTVDASPE